MWGPTVRIGVSPSMAGGNRGIIGAILRGAFVQITPIVKARRPLNSGGGHA